MIIFIKKKLVKGRAKRQAKNIISRQKKDNQKSFECI